VSLGSSKKTTTTTADTTSTTANSSGVARVDIDRIYKFMIYTSFLINVVLIAVLIFLGIQLFILKKGLAPAKPIVANLTSAIEGLKSATIRAEIPLQRDLPIALNVPVRQSTNVRLTQSVPLQVPADITLPGVGFLSAQVALNLPEGLELPVYLEMDIPLETSIPISITVPVAIQMKDTELYPEFEKLGNLVKPLADLVNGEQQPK
jgi:hypothetical protein